MTDEHYTAAEQRARRVIDGLLEQAGWKVQKGRELNLFAGPGIAVRERVMAPGHGRADYLLYVDKRVVGVIEAKPEGTPLIGVEWQSAMYATGLPEAHRKRARLHADRLPFVFESTGTETRYTDGFDPEPRSRRVVGFPRPETLARRLRHADAAPDAPTWRGKVRTLPDLDPAGLRPAQIEAINGIERSLAEGRHARSLVQMATGAGKTYTAAMQCYRLLRFGGFQRVLFLVDRTNLGRQTVREFGNFSVPGDGRKFTELYNVDKLTGPTISDSTKVVVSTIQRVHSVLRGEPVPEGDDEQLDSFTPDRPVEVGYSKAMPPETFDLVIVDECHRSIYGSWRGVLEYFDAHVIGLTATPGKQTFGFFGQNLVSEYTYAQAVADGVNVDFDVYRIRTQISESGSRVDAGTVVPTRDRRTRQERYETLDEDLDYTAGQLDRAVTARSQIRTVLETFRDRLFTEIFPGRTSVPKTLIFCKDDNHAEEVTQLVREVFGKGNDFAAKITYSAKEPDKLLAAFRNSATLRVVTTVDMIATGTDVKPLECVMFLRDVRSAAYFEQMKGRGARTIPDADLQSVTPGALHKDRFVLVDAVGVTEHEYIDAAPLNRKKSEPLDKLLGKVAALTATEDDVATIASRLARLEKDLTDTERSELAALAGMDLTAITRGLVEALDPDRQAAAIEAAGPGADPVTVREELIEAAITPLASNPELRARLVDLRKQHDIVIDETSQDTLLEASGVPAAERAKLTVTSWREFIERHKDEITALQVLYSHPDQRVTYEDLRALANRIQAPPYRWTPDLLWQAYEDLDASKVRRSDRHAVTDLIRLVRYELQRDGELVPYRDVVEERYQGWLLRQEQAGAAFTEEQRWWLDAIRDTVVQAAGVHLDDLDEAPFTSRNGLDGAYAQFGADIQHIVIELDRELGA